MKRCINCRQEIIDFGGRALGEFQMDLPPKSFYTGTDFVVCDKAHGDVKGTFYPFVREGEDGCFWHLRLLRGFVRGQIFLRIDEVFTSYLRHNYNIAQCSDKVPNNSSYSRLLTVSDKARVVSPWFIVENDKAALLTGLEQLAEWYRQNEEAIFAACRRQQGWVDKEQSLSHRLARLYLREHWQEADQGAVWALYRQVDRLARDYKAARDRGDFRYGDEHTFFSDWCSGRLPAPFDRWEDELAALYQRKKSHVTTDPAYAHSFAVGNLLYFIHDLEKDVCPDILIARRWTEEPPAEG